MIDWTPIPREQLPPRHIDQHGVVATDELVWSLAVADDGALLVVLSTRVYRPGPYGTCMTMRELQQGPVDEETPRAIPAALHPALELWSQHPPEVRLIAALLLDGRVEGAGPVAVEALETAIRTVV